MLVIEAGGDARANPFIYDLGNFGQALAPGSELDWAYPTEANLTIHGHVAPSVLAYNARVLGTFLM